MRLGGKVFSFANFIILGRPKDGPCTEVGGSINKNKKAFFELVFLGSAYLFFRQTIDMEKVGPQEDAIMKVISMLLHFVLSLFTLCHS